MRALLLLGPTMLAACTVSSGDQDDGTPAIPAQGTGTTRTYAAADFTAVELRGSDNVDIRVGPGFSVRADGDDALLDHLKISRVGQTLRVSRVRSSGFSLGNSHAKISITMPALAEVSVAGSGDMTVDRAAGASFRASGAGSGQLNVGTVQADRATVSLAGSGGVRLAGTTKQLDVNVAGSGDVDAGGLTATEASVSVAGSGNVRATVQGPARVNVMGSGDVDLGGRAQCQVSKMGSGSVRCGG